MQTHMKYTISIFLFFVTILSCSEKSTEPQNDEFVLQPYAAVDVSKSNSTKIYMHYMPWFESKDINGYWGSHWTMATQNPDIIDNNGRRQIASYLYPLIGPYSSMDKDVIEYHLLLMKLAGVDGLFIDWYGSYDVLDYGQNLINSEALIDRLDETGLQFAIVYEDFTAENVAVQGRASSALVAARADMRYLANNYFSNGQYIQIDNNPLFLTFGPRYFKTENDWTQIFSVISAQPKFLTLWYQSMQAGDNADGEFAWVYEDHLTGLENFYNLRATGFDIAIGAAYPGFKDFYDKGGWPSNIDWQIAYNSAGTLSATLDAAGTAGISVLQLVTWNDFGEGTVLEPTVEFGFSFLEKIQDFTGVSYNTSDLELVYQLYKYRKQFAGDSAIQLKLDQVFYYMVSLQLDKARALIDTIQ